MRGLITYLVLLLFMGSLATAFAEKIGTAVADSLNQSAALIADPHSAQE